MLPLVALLAAAPAWADISLNPFISNSGFETLDSPLGDCGTANGTHPFFCNGTVASWTPQSSAGGSGGAGTVQLSGQTGAVFAETELPSLQGDNAAYINNFAQFNSGYEAISQTLGNVTLAPSTTYSLTYAVARRADDVGGHFRIQVNAVGSGPAVQNQNYWILAGDTTTFTAGDWVGETLTFTTPASLSLFGQTPTVYLVNDGSDAPSIQGNNFSVAQIEFDTPEPALFFPLAMMVGIVALSLRSRRRVS